MLRRILAASIASVALLCVALVLLLWANPPDLIRVGSAYTAKTLCSSVFLSNRDPAQVLETDVQAPGHPLLRLMRMRIDRRLGTVRVGLLGFIGPAIAVLRADAGCAVIPDGRLDYARMTGAPKPGARRPGASAPEAPLLAASPSEPGGARDMSFSVAALEKVVGDDGLSGPGMRAVVIVNKGRLVAERYAAGFDPRTPQLGWSMTKTVTAGLIGLLVKDGRLTLGQSAGLQGGGRDRITVADLMSMTSGLKFNEGYGSVSDVTRMLYLEPDMARFAGTQPMEKPVGAAWSYSSGTAVVLARLFQDVVGKDAISFVKQRLFEPLGMTSAIIESDEAGTLVGSSYMYATPRDWARYGQLLVQDGIWEGNEILPRGYVAMMASPVAPSGGKYGHGMVWRWIDDEVPDRNPDAGSGIPSDTFWMSGHDGQFMAIVPSRQLVVLRMGLTPERLGYHPEPLVRAAIEATR